MPLLPSKVAIGQSERALARVTLRWWGALTWSKRVVTLAFLGVAAGLLLQPDRFARTPAYHNLLTLCSAQTWGALYLGCGLMLFGASMIRGRTRMTAQIMAHTLATMLAGWWLLAFVIRFATDDSTTVVNVVSWSVYVILLLHSGAEVIDRETAP